MRIPVLGRMDKKTKQTFIAGLAGGLTFHLEQAAAELVPNYPVWLYDPAGLKDHVVAGLPRNGALLASTGPLVAAWVAPKILKKHSEGVKNVRLGITLYDGPTIMHQLVRWAAYQAGVSMRLGTPASLGGSNGMIRIRPNNPSYNRAVPTPSYSSGGRYRVSSTAPSRGYSGVGRYRVS